MKLLTAAIGGACLTLAAQASAVTFATGDARAVAEPAVPTLCQPALKASQTPDGRLFEAALESAPPDTRTIQAALTACKNGAVLLTSGSGNAFLTGPLTIPAGVTLVVDQGVTVYGSRNPADYGSGCGTAGSKSGSCLPLIGIKGANAGVMGMRTGGRQGTIDGRGDLAMLGKSATWWEFGENAKNAGQVQNSPDLIKVQNATAFTLYNINLINAAYFHFFAHIVDGLTIWGVRVKSPATSPNTDALDLDSVLNATIQDSDVMSGDDGVAIKTIASRSANISVLNSRFYGTHGISIGSELMSGVSNVLVDNNVIVSTDDDGNRSTDNNGLRIKTSLAKGGAVDLVTYRNTCLYGVSNPLVINPFYGSARSGSVPTFRRIVVDGLRSVDGRGGKGWVLQGADASAPLDLVLANVASDNLVNTTSNAAIGLSNSALTPSGSGVVTTAVQLDGAVPACPGASQFPAL
ncbi:TPA: endopolygalacturonase [Xanthomonas vasicola pv. zeae]|uniref:Endopolygalacturonase n=1 Tax=Xanthomonas vasicola pv. vasculorum TaxID=325776 RepID=A0AAE8F857_XANVA|nr:glycosyl hydrolase family 28 protein [Xanthomonas vasicola]AVQ05848.1 endopolygalacturonase [Xanthomonas vasicola pv. vasculorum]AZM70047.1 endopolygalacturonase [Xanthomonas vasicola pv. vasculorum]AZR28027.1 endopolygalacturonase [Xanthomonas vasicola pv. arecae]KEZ96511.1 endopolygalacturonase [Xanthomonas vasicola pv. vasculorum NCPPB 895]MBV7304675.1 glycoside hydrolase family 28 protein [Xanthomonas vasicola pv. vasculorum]